MKTRTYSNWRFVSQEDMSGGDLGISENITRCSISEVLCKDLYMSDDLTGTQSRCEDLTGNTTANRRSRSPSRDLPGVDKSRRSKRRSDW